MFLYNRFGMTNKWRSEGRKGRTAPGCSQEGAAKVGEISGHQASNDFWERQNCSPPGGRYAR